MELENIINKELIEKFIKSNNLTKGKFCKMCKIDYSTLKRILTGQDFYIIALFKIARVMNIQVCNLFVK